MSATTERPAVVEKKFGCYEAWLGWGDGILFGDKMNGVFVQLVDNDRISVLDFKDNEPTPFDRVLLLAGEPYSREFDGSPIKIEAKGLKDTSRQIMVSAPEEMMKRVVRSEFRKKPCARPI